MIEKIIFKKGEYEHGKAEKGDFQFWEGHPMLCCPKCGNPADLIAHTVIFKNGGITVEPSIGHMPCRLHIFIRDNKIEYLPDL